MDNLYQTVLCMLAMICAAIVGYCSWKVFEKHKRRSKHRAQVMKSGSGGLNGDAPDLDPKSFDAHIIGFAEHESKRISFGHGNRLLPDAFAHAGWFMKNSEYSGLKGSITEAGFCEARLKLTVVGLLSGFIVGLLFSVELALILAIVGAFFGYRALQTAIKHRIDWRSQEMERHLPEMLDVVAIGMRSGLSFDRSLEIYSSKFPTLLAGELSLAQRQWTTGLARRDDALREVAATYDSLVFSRVVESIIRSIRFGSSMIEGLEAAAREARVNYRTRRQEQVAKAPVKMMVPTGTLILPAMLILVLGPVLLELIGGGI